MKNFKYLLLNTICLIIIFLLTSCAPKVVIKDETDKITSDQPLIHKTEPQILDAYKKVTKETEQDSQIESEMAEEITSDQEVVQKATEADEQIESEMTREETSSIDSVASIAPYGTINKLEQDLRDSLAKSRLGSIEREGDFLTVILNSDALFDLKSVNIRSGADSELSHIADIMARYSQIFLSVEGHTDSKGSEMNNIKLSKQRAEAVKRLLVQKGFGESQIEVIALGESKPLSSNQTEAGRRKNRRIEIKIKTQD